MSGIESKRVLLATITILFWFAQYVYIPFLTPYLLSLSITATVVGVIVGAYGVTQLLLRIPLGIITDIVGNHKIFIIIGTFLAGISSMMIILFGSPAMLFLSNALSGVASSTWISFTLLYSSYYDRSEGTKAIGLVTSLQNIGILAAFLLGGIFSAQFGSRSLFILSFVFGMAGFILSLFIKPETAGRTNVTATSLVKVMKDKKLLIVSLLGGFVWFLMFGTIYSFTTSTAKELGATGLQLGIIYVLFSLMNIIGSYFVSTKASRNLSEKTNIALGFALLAVYCAGVAVAPVTIWFFPLQIVGGFGAGTLTAILMAIAVRNFDADKKSTAMGFYQSVYSLGITFGPIVMGILVDHFSKIFSFSVMAIIALACSIFVLSMYKFSVLFKEV
ncbi:MFS transporter [Desulfosporosinus sp. PR]|uniref:MFS transporter n=1 Tax=Candidatus Desulfosporosinus nitrosoreducens TaxID=3401928 RepID=UPI0027ED610E|nr:MFS transporter [Desulfosporosinus sp. PR]MDQ7092157.1 MFS transporter [Desulfosporosinus sp. PR]